MKTYALDFSSTNFGRIQSYVSRKEAESAGNGRILAAKEEDLFEASLPLALMTTFYNAVTGENRGLFKDRKQGASRLFALSVAKAIDVIPAPEEEPVTEASTETTEKVKRVRKPKVEKAEKVEGAARGRLSRFSGKLIKSNCIAEGNPRRPGSVGFHSHEVILAAGSEGIVYEAFIEKGGDRNQLDWDVNHNHVTLS